MDEDEDEPVESSRYSYEAWFADFGELCKVLARSTTDYQAAVHNFVKGRHSDDIDWKAVRLCRAFEFLELNKAALESTGASPPGSRWASGQLLGILYSWLVVMPWKQGVPMPPFADVGEELLRLERMRRKNGIGYEIEQRIVATTSCSDPEEFLAALSPRSRFYSSLFPRGWVSRGHSDETFLLLPSALRDESRELENLALHSIKTNKDQVRAEKAVLSRFLQIADSIGLSIPEDTQRLRGFLDRLEPLPQLWPPDSVLSLMALAQHHGVPTRLLDWSRHPLKAAWFAAARAIETENISDTLSVWSLGLEFLERDRHSPALFTIVTAPAASNPNLRAQEGVFTLANRILVDELPINRRTFDEFVCGFARAKNLQTSGPCFRKITLPRVHAEKLLFLLALEGITRATLFPDFYGVANSIKDMARWYKEGGPGRIRALEHAETFFVSVDTEVKVSDHPNVQQVDASQRPKSESGGASE